MVLQLGLYFVIAHKIDPSDLGHYFLASTLIFIPIGILEFGFVSSIIQKNEINNDDYNAVFQLNLKSIFIYLSLGLLATILLAWYYETPHLWKYYMMLSPLLICTSYNSVQNAGLKRALLTKRFATIEIAGMLTVVAFTLVLLYAGYGIEAVIAGQVARGIVVMISLKVFGRQFRISRKKDTELTQYHWDYGKYIIGEKVMGIGLAQADVFLVHHFLGAHTLGIYDMMKRMILRPVVAAYSAMEHVTFPLLSRAVEKPKEYSRLFSSIIRTNYIFFLSFALIFIAEWVLSFFPVVYQEQIMLFRLLIILSVTIVILNPVDIIAYGLDLTKRYFNWVLLYGIVQLLAMAFSLALGLEQFIFTMIGFNILVYVLSYFVIARPKTEINLWQWVEPVVIFVLVCLVTYYILVI